VERLILMKLNELGDMKQNQTKISKKSGDLDNLNKNKVINRT
jgi:hypothetical protein